VVSREHFELARRFRAVYSKYERGRDLVQIGAYAHGSDPALDEAIALHDGMGQFLQQDMYEAAPMDAVLDQMVAATSLHGGGP
jgi:flagellum-specific ATP synthase